MKRQHMVVGTMLLSLFALSLLSGCNKEKTVSPEELNKQQAESLKRESGAPPGQTPANNAKGGNTATTE